MFTSRTGAAGATVLAAVLGLSALTACEFPGKEKDAEPSVSSPAASGPAEAPSAEPSEPESTDPTAPADTDPAAVPTAGPADGATRTVVDARTAGGLPRYTGADQVSDLPLDPGDMRDGMNLVVAEYGRMRGQLVLVVAVDGVPEDTVRRREHLFRGALGYLSRGSDDGYAGADGVPSARAFPAGPLGGSVECIPLSSAASGGNVVCGWADQDTAAIAIFEDSSVEAAAARFVRMRADLEH